jgi:hypothetical protein
MDQKLPYDIHEAIIANHIKSYADFKRYLILINDIEMVRMLIARFEKTVAINNFFTFKNSYKEGITPDKYITALSFDNVTFPVPYFANLLSIQLCIDDFNPAFFANYSHIDEIEFIWDNSADGQTIARTFPNLRKASFYNWEYMKSVIPHLPNLRYVRLSYESNDDPEYEFTAKHKNIEFLIYGDEDMIVDEPNVKYYLSVELSELYIYHPFANKIIEMEINIYNNSNEENIEIPSIFSELVRLRIIIFKKEEIRISGFHNLDIIIIEAMFDCDTTIYLSDLPYLRKVECASNCEVRWE